MGYNLNAAAQQAQAGKKNEFVMARRKTLEEALLEAKFKPLTNQQKRIKDKYGDKWAASGNGEGCIFK